MSHRRLLSLVLLLSFLAGCSSPGEDPPSPSPTPVIPVTASATPSAASPTPDMTALYAEADRVYRAFLEAEYKYLLTGDFSEFPPEMVELNSPEHLRKTEALFKSYQEEGWHLTGGVPIVTTRPYRGVSRDGSELAMQVCYDARHLAVVDAQGVVQPPKENIALEVIFFNHLDGRLVISGSDAEVYVSCPF